MKQTWALGIAAILSLLAVLFAYHYRQGIFERAQGLVHRLTAPFRTHLKVGDRLPQLPVSSLSGTPSEIKPRRGHLLIINVFATWCPPCIGEAPAFASLSVSVSGKPVDIVGIDQQEDPSTIAAFAKAHSLNYEIYLDNQDVTQNKLGAYAIPTTFVVDDRGVIEANIRGPVTLPEMDRLIQSGLKGLSARS